MMPHQARVDWCMCGMRENTHGSLVWKPWRIKLERGCVVFGAHIHNMEEHALHDFPIQGPRTTHWLSLEIARSELGPWWRQA